MPRQGKHRRQKDTQTGRHLTIAGIGGSAIALPLVCATTADSIPQLAPTTEHTSTLDTHASSAATHHKPVTYTVAPGDSLSTIAAKFSLPGGWQKLYRDNRTSIGDNPSAIRTGMKLLVNGGSRSTASPHHPGSKVQHSSAPRTRNKTYPNNLDGWIRESLAVMSKHGIPGSYQGIYRNVMRESSGNPQAVNNWDSNAAAGTPSKGLLQIIAPTFAAYHVPGTSMNPFDPVANITAACHYAAARYGSIDNVHGAY
ncbi:transglycosylase SLT domain-containing protein [Streptomyces sp. NPDC051133]|uniref:transglycosylase SLT domain-containing protein n=1 Tax=Streptomyces sp. NPDC051133 TaxID=3155521 RepID=UPI00343DC14D